MFPIMFLCDLFSLLVGFGANNKNLVERSDNLMLLVNLETNNTQLLKSSNKQVECHIPIK